MLEDFTTKAGASQPFGFWDPAGISKELTTLEFNKLQESEIKHGNICLHTKSVARS